MGKAVRMLNDYQIKALLLSNQEIQYENFYKEELIQFIKIARKILKELKGDNNA